MPENLQFVLFGAAITCGLFPLFLLLLRRPRPMTEEELDRNEPAFGGWTEPLAAQFPQSYSSQAEVQKLLMGAGFYHPTALLEYRAARVALTLAPLFLAGAFVLILPRERSFTVLIVGLLAAVLGFSIPRVYLDLKRRQRGRAISRGLPLAIDLLTLCLSAGQNLLAAFYQVSRELRVSHPVLSQELAITARQAELHSLDVAVRQWAERCQVPEVSNLSSLLVQSERLGSDTSATLTELSNNFRTTARQRAEAHANRVSFWMLFPSVFCFWVAAAIILIGPAYLEFFEYRQRSGAQLINETRSNIDRANRVRRERPDPFATPNAPGTTAPAPAAPGGAP